MANKSSILMEGATLPAERYAEKILELLGRSDVVIEVSRRKEPSGSVIRFSARVEGQELLFQLAPNVQGVTRQFQRFHGRAPDREKSERIAWAQLDQWAELQVAMIEGGSLDFLTAFLPFLLNQGAGELHGLTWAEIQRGALKALPAAQERRD